MSTADFIDALALVGFLFLTVFVAVQIVAKIRCRLSDAKEQKRHILNKERELQNNLFVGVVAGENVNDLVEHFNVARAALLPNCTATRWDSEDLKRHCHQYVEDGIKSIQRLSLLMVSISFIMMAATAFVSASIKNLSSPQLPATQIPSDAPLPSPEVFPQPVEEPSNEFLSLTRSLLPTPANQTTGGRLRPQPQSEPIVTAPATGSRQILRSTPPENERAVP